MSAPEPLVFPVDLEGWHAFATERPDAAVTAVAEIDGRLVGAVPDMDAEAIGEVCGCINATGSDTRSFCAGPAHAMVEAAALVKAGIYKNVVVVAGGASAKLGLNATDHLFHHGISIDPNTSLMVVMGVLFIGIVASFIFPGKDDDEAEVEKA